MTKVTGSSSYFYISSDSVGITSEKHQNACQFLTVLHEKVGSGVVLQYPDTYTLKTVVDKVTYGYESKQGLVHRLWTCFLRFLASITKFELFMNDAQKIWTYASELNDPVKMQRMAVLKNSGLPDDKKAELVQSPPGQFLPSLLKEKLMTHTLKELVTYALNNHDVPSAKKALMAIEKAQFAEFAIYQRVIEACLLTNDQSGATEVMQRCLLTTISDEKVNQFNEVVHTCYQANKIDLLLATMKASITPGTSNKLFASVANIALVLKDKNLLLKLGDNVPKQLLLPSMDLLLGDTPKDVEIYKGARSLALPHQFNPDGVEALTRIIETIIKAQIGYELILDLMDDLQIYKVTLKSATLKSFDIEMRLAAFFNKMTEWLPLAEKQLHLDTAQKDDFSKNVHQKYTAMLTLGAAVAAAGSM